jgi:hypothetical protein
MHDFSGDDLSGSRSNLKSEKTPHVEVEPRRLRWYFAFVLLTTLTEACFVATTLPLSLG